MRVVETPYFPIMFTNCWMRAGSMLSELSERLLTFSGFATWPPCESRYKQALYAPSMSRRGCFITYSLTIQHVGL